MVENRLEKMISELRPNPADYMPIARQIKQGNFPDLHPLRVALLATFTADPLNPYIVVESARFGLSCDLFTGPFNQIEPLILNHNSDLYQHQPEVIILALSIEDIAPKLYYEIPEADAIDTEICQVKERLQNLISSIRNKTDATILIWNFAEPVYLSAGLADVALEPSQASTIQQLNDECARAILQYSGVHVVDIRRIAGECGLKQWMDPKLSFLGRLPFGVKAQHLIGRHLARYLNAIYFPPRKCLVLDLDNTLWGGVIGEDGLGGIALGEDYPGNIYKNFHKNLLALRSRGILLAIASKNNLSDALNVFEKHPDCLLKSDHFTSVQIGWQDKATSLETIAKELNIGTDALVFFDDNPVEREWVKTKLPEVMTIEVPANPLDYVRALHESGAFDYLTISEEDRKRSEIYQQDKQRDQFKENNASVEDFLCNLNMHASLGFVNSDTLPRVVQLLGKTNQFNVTTRRHTASHLENLIKDGAIAIWLRLSDRFGDNGLIGLAIVTPETQSKWVIDSLLLSCRVIGRQVEQLLVAHICRLVRQRDGKELVGEFIPTAKNALAKTVYADCGFESIDNGNHLWRWDLSWGDVSNVDYISQSFEEP